MKDQDQIPVDIAAVAKKFSQWRDNRRNKKDRIPDFLWSAAGKLLKHHKPSAICRVLRINQTELKKRSESVVPALRVTRVEVSAPVLSSSVAKLTRPDGVILELAGAMSSDQLLTLVNAFCRGHER